jgi:hypothetical protein
MKIAVPIRGRLFHLWSPSALLFGDWYPDKGCHSLSIIGVRDTVMQPRLGEATENRGRAMRVDPASLPRISDAADSYSL